MEGANILKEIQLRNFRSFKDTGMQELAPITILVGENSSGKSSFLRLFPLLKQSISKKTSGPILWSGDVDDYVDFGSFDETVINDGSNYIEFGFKFKFVNMKQGRFLTDKDEDLPEIYYKMFVVSKNGTDEVSRVEIHINSCEFVFDITNNTITVDNIQIGNIIMGEDRRFGNLIFEPLRAFCFESGTFGFELPTKQVCSVDYAKEYFLGEKKYAFPLFEDVRNLADIGHALVCNIKLNPMPKWKNKGNDIFLDKEDYEIRRIKYNELIKRAPTDDKLQAMSKLMYLYYIFPSIDDYISSYFKQVHYIAPLRATAERYYRIRNLAVNEVDYQGKNLAVFINSLKKAEKKEFNDWTRSFFGFAIEIDKSKGHLSLLVKLDGAEKPINLSDTGFGYSQILPIITQLWVLSTRREENSRLNPKVLIPLVFAIEQPELHLHPAVQVKLVKAFIASIELARKHGYQLQLILETHSETIVNYFGRAIAKKMINPKDISVKLFEKDKETNQTKIRNSYYDEKGFLTNWPYGFFYAED